MKKKDNVIEFKKPEQRTQDLLTEIAREGAKKMLAALLPRITEAKEALQVARINHWNELRRAYHDALMADYREAQDDWISGKYKGEQFMSYDDVLAEKREAGITRTKESFNVGIV